MIKLGLTSLIAMLAAFTLAGPGCSDAENAFNCDQICDRYKECFDQDYDDAACESECRDNAEDDGFADKAEACETCLDDKSCTGSFSCVDECIGIVP